jgi:hypothetical protein
MSEYALKNREVNRSEPATSPSRRRSLPCNACSGIVVVPGAGSSILCTRLGLPLVRFIFIFFAFFHLLDFA